METRLKTRRKSWSTPGLRLTTSTRERIQLLQFNIRHQSAGGWRLAALILLVGCGLFFIFKPKVDSIKSSKLISDEAGLVITPAQQHLGKLNQHESRAFSFEVKNTSQEPMTILGVEHSCGCTESRMDREILQPGETGRITGTLNAQDRVGEFGSEIVVRYAKGLREGVRVSEQAKVLVGARAVTELNMPTRMDLGESLLGTQPETHTFELSRGEADLPWDEIKVVSDKVKSDIQKIGADRWKITLTPPLGNVVGQHREELQIHLVAWQKPKPNPSETGTEKEIKRISLPLTWKTTSKHFAMYPTGFYLQGDKPKRVKMVSLRGEKVQISGIDIPENAPIQLRTVKGESGSVWLELQSKETLLIPNDSKRKEPWSGKIQISLHDGRVEEKIWLTAIIKGEK